MADNNNNVNLSRVISFCTIKTSKQYMDGTLSFSLGDLFLTLSFDTNNKIFIDFYPNFFLNQ